MNRAAPAIASLLAALAVAGCATQKPAALSSRKEPAVVLATSQRTNDGGIRLFGRLDPGVYPITRTALEYTIAEPSAAPPVSPDETGKRYVLKGSKVESVPWKKGSREIPYAIGGDAARRALRGKVLWYRWIVEYDHGGPETTETDVHYTSLEEAGLPRSASTPGPDGSIALPAPRKR